MDSSAELARRLSDSLANLADRHDRVAQTAAAQNFAAAAEQLKRQLETLPNDLRYLLQSADSGFPATGQWVDDAIARQASQLAKLARSARMVADWHGPDGRFAERMFLIRGHIRGWAHRWRTEGKGPAQAGEDADFMEFARSCLEQAGINERQEDIIKAALRNDWRIAPF
jgi:hypothetical protein